MKTNYNDCLTRLLKDEGGYSNDPHDPGGPTNFGITLTDYRKYIKSSGTADDVKNMTVDQAKKIYKPKYWDAMGCDALASGVDYTVFDYGVNSGTGRASKVLAKARQQTADPIQLITAINDERMAFLRSLSTWGVFGKGWQRRVDGVRKHSLELVDEPATTNVIPATGGAVAVVAAGGVAMASTPQNYWPWIIAGAVLAAIIAFFAIHKGNQ